MVEVIPKPVKKTPSWQIILFYFSIALVIILIFAYLALGSLQGDLEEGLQTLKDRLSEDETSQRIDLEKEVLGYKTKIDDTLPLLQQHVLSSKFFDFLESRTHPKTFFSKISLSPGRSKVTLSGLTDSFLALGQQLLILNEDPLVKNSKLIKVSLFEEGGVEFEISILLDETLFRY
ncbi:MAG: hypothetical protein KJI71_04725 [Patescibacteria group bacterium]|nr:hypothetical protein [Patescibacteria group bacterium]